MEKEIEEDKKSWYQTNWVWFWLVLFWPVGLFGLLKRGKSENIKYWVGGFVFLFFLSLFDSGEKPKNKISSTKTKPKVYGYPATTGGYVACMSESLFDEFGMAQVQGDNSAMNYLLENHCLITKAGLKITVLDRGFGVSKIRIYSNNNTVVMWTNTENISK